MSPEAFVAQVRDHYLEQFKTFVRQQEQSASKGAPEVKLRLSDESQLFHQLYCADFIKGEERQVVEFQPDRVLTFEPLHGSFGDATLIIKDLRWDDVVICHDAAEPLEKLPGWFENWFDPEDQRLGSGNDVGNVIHSLLVEPGTLSIDMGSAPAEALWEVLEVLEGSGATEIRIIDSRAEAAN